MYKYFDYVKVPSEILIGEEGLGFKIALSTLDGGRIGIASQALGIAQASLEASIKYSKERIQFSKPIAENQAIQYKIADMVTDGPILRKPRQAAFELLKIDPNLNQLEHELIRTRFMAEYQDKLEQANIS